jgi:hypothetical protein
MAADLISPPPSRSSDSAARAFARVGWPKVWARLYRYATGTLGLAAIDARRGRVFEAADLVNALCVRALLGRLDWSLPEDATDKQIIGSACTKLHGMRSTLRRKAARTVCDDALDERPDPGPGALARLMKARGSVDLEAAFAHDAEASVYVGEMLKGEARADIMDTLGWTPKRANAVYMRIMRRVAALAQRTNDDGEGAEACAPCALAVSRSGHGLVERCTQLPPRRVQLASPSGALCGARPDGSHTRAPCSTTPGHEST